MVNSMSRFTHLHLHTHYSTLDGAIKPKRLMEKLKEDGQKAVAITDHGNMHGVIDFYKEARANDIKPIIGCEVYVAEHSRFDRDKDHKIFHLVLLAINKEGYQNLLKLVSLGYEEGFYYKPRVDKELLELYGDGLVASSACISGVVPKYLLTGNEKKAYEAAEFFKFNFDKRFFLEIQRNELSDQEKVNKMLIKLSRDMNIPLVATCDSHYLNKEDAKIQDMLILIQTKKTELTRTMEKLPEHFYVKTQEEMIELFSDIPEAIKSTRTIADMCDVEIELGKFHFPVYDIKRNDDYKEFLKWKENE